MTTTVLETLPNMESFIRLRVEVHRHSYQRISEEVKEMFPGSGHGRGLGSRNIRRFCKKFNISKISSIDENTLDSLVRDNINKVNLLTHVIQVGRQYGRKTMTGLLASQGYRVGENRVATSLQRVNPRYHATRMNRTHRLMNPTPYMALYYGEKIHIDQNEKLSMFGVTHIIGVDGYSKKIVGFCTMPIKNAAIVYERFFRPITLEHGIWSQVRVDHGTEWALLLYVQNLLRNYRYDTSKHPYVQTTSMMNHVVERMWVEVNSRINYPIKKCLLDMIDSGLLPLQDQSVQFCVSWYTIHVCNIGFDLFIQAWNEHPLSSTKGCTMRGTPNQRMMQNCCIHALDPSVLPTTAQAISQYRQSGGRISETSTFGCDPLALFPDKIIFRETAFKQQFSSFSAIYYQLINDDVTMFQNGLKYFIDLTYRLSNS